MINVNQITAKLATLPDQALQQYAMMNKNDPYIMSLAMSESTRRQEIRTAAQGAQGGMQEPPKVVDQAIAGMAPQPQQMPQQMGQPMPEDSGIGQLPAGDMEFANGGIISFAEGRAIPGARASWEDDLEDLVQGGRPQGRSFGVDFFTRSSDKEKIKAREAEAEAAAGANAAAAAAAAPVTARDPLTSDLPANNANPLRSTVVPEISTEAEVAPAAPVGIAQVAPMAQQQGSMSYEDIMKMSRADPNMRQAAMDELDLVGAAAEDAERQGIARLKKDQTEMGEYGKEREASLRDKEAGLAALESKNLNMSLIEAGLAMMSGTSANALENIGKGALVGTKAYKEGVAAVDAKREKIDEALMNLHDIRRGEKRVNAQELRAAEKGLTNAVTASAKTMASQKLSFLELDEKTAGAAATTYATIQSQALDRAAANERARFQTDSQRAVAEAQISSADRRAAMPGKDERLYAALADPKSDVSKGLTNYAAAMGKDKDTATRDFVAYITAATKNADPLNPPNMDTLLQQFLAAEQRLGGGRMTSSLPPGAQTVK